LFRKTLRLNGSCERWDSYLKLFRYAHPTNPRLHSMSLHSSIKGWFGEVQGRLSKFGDLAHILRSQYMA
jgi:hypothetical protein